MRMNRILSTIVAALAAISIVVAVMLGGVFSDNEDSPVAAPTAPPVVATIEAVVVTPTPEPTPRPAAIVVRPEPTLEPVADEADAEPEPRPGAAPWVYYYPTECVPDVNEWSEAWRWQDPLPTIEVPVEWGGNTWRTPYPTFDGYRDRPFIRAYDRTYETLPRQVEADMHAIFKAHHELLPAWAEMNSTHELGALESYVAGSLEQWLPGHLDELRMNGYRIQVGPHVHEIIAMTIFGDRAEVLQVYRNWADLYCDMDTNERHNEFAVGDIPPSGNVGYTYAQWSRIDGRWVETSIAFFGFDDLTPVEWLLGLSPPLFPYILVWEDALAQEAAARAAAP